MIKKNLLLFVSITIVSCSTINTKEKNKNYNIEIMRIGNYVKLPDNNEVKLISIKDYNEYILIGIINITKEINPFDFIISENSDCKSSINTILVIPSKDNIIYSQVEKIARQIGGDGLYLLGSEIKENILYYNAPIKNNIIELTYEVMKSK